MLLLAIVFILLEREVVIVELATSPEMSVHATDVTFLVASLRLLVPFKLVSL